MYEPLSFDPIEEAGRQWRRHWGPGMVAPMTAVTSVMRVQQLWLSRLNEELKPYDLTFPRYEALMLLYFSRSGALPLGKMGARLQVHPTSVTSLVDGLERLGYAQRTPHPSDGGAARDQVRYPAALPFGAGECHRGARPSPPRGWRLHRQVV